jgi:hypothetical protein
MEAPRLRKDDADAVASRAGAATRPGQRGAGDEDALRPGALPGAVGPRALAARLDGDPGLADQRVCLLHGYAHKDARARGESEQRWYLLDAERDCPFYSERERAALLWTEAVTL